MHYTSKGIKSIPNLDVLTNRGTPDGGRQSVGSVFAGWGRKRSGALAERLAARDGMPFWLLEDGFLRSFGTGDCFPPLSLVVDDRGIYYDCTRPSELESRLASEVDVLQGRLPAVQRARRLILDHYLSKYNHMPLASSDLFCATDRKRVLVVDQTFGDLSIRYGAADEGSFRAMLDAACAENPNARIYVKTHPETSSGRKRGYLTDVSTDDRIVVLRDAINPLSLIEQMDHVYVVTSTMGFEALLAGKRVTCFGLPWYAGWGATDDRQRCSRRTRSRSVDELFAAAYFDYTHYLNPVTRQAGTIFDVIHWLIRQREMAFDGILSDQRYGKMIDYASSDLTKNRSAA